MTPSPPLCPLWGPALPPSSPLQSCRSSSAPTPTHRRRVLPFAFDSLVLPLSCPQVVQFLCPRAPVLLTCSGDVRTFVHLLLLVLCVLPCHTRVREGVDRGPPGPACSPLGLPPPPGRQALGSTWSV